MNTPGSSPTDRLHVVIAGGGVAALEAALALRDVAGNRCSVTLLADATDYVHRPLSVGEPFSSSHADHHPLAALATRAGAQLRHGRLERVDPQRRVVHAADGTAIAYDALLVAVGAHPHPVFPLATTIDDARMDELLHGLVQDVEGGYVRRLAVVVPAPMPWPLPAYELALMASERAWDMQTDLDITLMTPERRPLEAFGGTVGAALGALLSERRIEIVTSAYCEVPEAGTVTIHPGGRTVHADRVVALPQLRGPALTGLPQDGGGFIPVDDLCRVDGVDRVWAAGDAADLPVKLGGVAAQMAETAALSIAALAGAAMSPPPLRPVLEGVLMTGGTARHLRYRPAGDGVAEESVFGELAGRIPSGKVAAPRLAAELNRAAQPATA